MKVILATGVPHVNTKIEKKFIQHIDIVGKPLFREAVEATVERTKADVLILSDELDGVIGMDELIKKMRARYPKTRIIYISQNVDADFKAFLYKLYVFDILNGKFTADDLKNAFFAPKQWTDVSTEIEGLDEFQKNPDGGRVKRKEIKDMGKIDEDYEKIKPLEHNSDSLYQEFIAFWSVLDQTGKTFSAVNTSLFLASNKDLKIILLDFNIKRPNIHFQFGFQDMDGNHNLGALIEDLEEGVKLTPQTLDRYLITHPVYNNLKILPGNILRMEDKDSDFYINILNHIYTTAQASNYSTILVDMDSGLRDSLSVHILKSATKILLHTNENPGALYATRKMFDPELGEFVPNKINKKKIYPVITRATDDFQAKFKHVLHIELDLDSNKTVAVFKEDPLVHKSVFEGAPIMKKPSDAYYLLFSKVANTIHPGFFKIKIKEKKPVDNPKSKPGISSIFGFGKKEANTTPKKK